MRKVVVRIIGVLLAVLFVAAISGVGFVYLAPESAMRVFLDLERKRAGLVRKELDLPGGTHYVYLEGGQGEPLMLLHGFGGNKDNFVRAARYLTPHYRVILPDNTGFGESSHDPAADYSPDAQASRLHALAQALGIKTLDLGGNSMGGQIALAYAALYPAEVKSLWLLDTAGIWSAPESELRKVIRETGRNPLMIQNEDDFAGLFPFVMNDPPFIPRPIRDVMARERINNFSLEQKIFAQIAADSVEERVTGLATPALIVWGDRDRTLNVGTAEILHKLMPNSQVIIMPGIGHLPMIERPQQSVEDYLKFRAKS